MYHLQKKTDSIDTKYWRTHTSFGSDLGQCFPNIWTLAYINKCILTLWMFPCPQRVGPFLCQQPEPSVPVYHNIPSDVHHFYEYQSSLLSKTMYTSKILKNSFTFRLPSLNNRTLDPLYRQITYLLITTQKITPMLYLTLLQIDANYLNNVTYLPSQHDPDHSPVVVDVFVYWDYLLEKSRHFLQHALCMKSKNQTSLSHLIQLM